MPTSSPRIESAVAAVTATLHPHPWRGFTPELLARWVLAAADRHGLADLLGSVPGAGIGSWAAFEAADPEDPRIHVLVEFLTHHRWEQFRLAALCRNLLLTQRDEG